MPTGTFGYAWKTTTTVRRYSEPSPVIALSPVVKDVMQTTFPSPPLPPIPPTPPAHDGVNTSFLEVFGGRDRPNSVPSATVSSSDRQRATITLSTQPNDTNQSQERDACLLPDTSETNASTPAPTTISLPSVRITPTSPVLSKSDKSPLIKHNVGALRASAFPVHISSEWVSDISTPPASSLSSIRGRRGNLLGFYTTPNQFHQTYSTPTSQPATRGSRSKSTLNRKRIGPRISESAEFPDEREKRDALDSPILLVADISSATVATGPDDHSMAIGEGNLEQSSRSPMCPLSECSSDHASTEPSPEPPPKPLRNRAWYVMAELVGTERAYVDDLQVLHEVYLTELMRDTSLNLTQDERERIALNVPEILAVHKPFAQNLEAVARDHGIVGTQTGADEGGVGDEKLAINAIALCFLDITSQLGAVYETFCSGHAEAAAIIHNIQHVPAFAAFEKACASRAANASSIQSSPLGLIYEDDAEKNEKDKPTSLSPNCQDNIPSTPTSNSPTPLRKASKSPLSKRASDKSLKRLSFTASSSPSKSAPPSPSVKIQAHSSSLRSRPSSSILWRRSSPGLLPQTEFHPDTPDTSDTPLVPPVPPLTPPGSPSPPTTSLAPTSKRLAFRDLLIKPIQRVCRYPLLLEQLLPPPLLKGMSNGDEAQETSSEDLLVKALMATKRVAHDVDVARAKRDIEVKTQRIVDRLDPTSSISSEFVASLGDIRLASSLDLIYHHPSLAPLTGVVRVRYCGAFVYDGYLLLVKVRKNKNFLPLHWLSLGNVEVEDVTEEPGLLPHSFKIKVADHTLELGASCIGEKDVWLRTLITIRSVPSQADILLQKSSLQIMEDQHAPPGESGPPRKRRQSILASTGFYVPSGHSSHATLPATISFIASTKLGASPVSEIESKPVLAEPVAPSKMERQWTTTSKRASAGKRSSIFLLDTFTTTYRRVAATERLLVDRTLTDMWSSECISIRTQAQLRGELFSHPKPHRPASTQDLTERGPWSKAATSFPGPTHTSLSKKAATSTLYARVRRQSAPPSPPRHHKTCSVPCGSSDPDELRGHSPIRKRMVASDKLGDPVLREPDNFGYMVWPQEISDDDAESFWDDVLSVTRTKLMSEDTQFPRNGNTVTEVKSDVDSADVPLPECKLTLPPERIPDQPPSKRSSFLTRSLTAVTRRRTKSTPSKVPPSLIEAQTSRNSSQVRSSSPIRSSRSTRNGHDSFLSPYWTKTSVVLRSASPIHFEPSPVVSPFPNSTPPPLPDPPEDMTGRSRSAIDLCRLEPLPSSSRKMTTSSTSSSSSATSHSARSIRSFFQHRNKFTSIL